MDGNSQAYAENEWKKATAVESADRLTSLPASQRPMVSNFWSRTRFATSRRRLRTTERPVAVGIPGYVLPTDLDARLFLKYPEEREVDHGRTPRSAYGQPRHIPAGKLEAYTVKGKTWGRARV